MQALPFTVTDLEASSLSLNAWAEISSYPIEVGVAIASVDGTIYYQYDRVSAHRAGVDAEQICAALSAS